jgi:hypothetical protein
MSLSLIRSSASGVTSRPVRPVPPVVMIASASPSSIHELSLEVMTGTSSLTTARAANW